MAVKSDKAFVRSFAKVLAVLFALAIAFIIISWIVSGPVDHQMHPSVKKRESAGRLAPAGKVAARSVALAGNTAAGTGRQAGINGEYASARQPELSGKQVVGQVCSACHASGLLGAPRIGDTAEWRSRFETQGGLSGLVGHAIHGIRSMPPRGGDPGLSDPEIHDAVEYMLSKAGLHP